jgi:hypothetical protein
VDEDTRATRAAVSANQTQQRSPEEIRADIEQTRAEVGDTVEALAAKTDVKARAQERVEEVKETVREKARDATPAPVQRGGQQFVDTARANPAPFVAAGLVVLAVILWRRSSR